MKLHPGFYGSLILVLSQIVTFFLVFQEKIFLQEQGITDALYYHMNLTADPIPLYYYGNEGGVSKLLGGVGGISLYPLGAFVNLEDLADFPYIPAHEGKHYSEQRIWGKWWYLAYGLEIAVRSFTYLDTDAGYFFSSFEQRARDWAGQQYEVPPLPWWQGS